MKHHARAVAATVLLVFAAPAAQAADLTWAGCAGWTPGLVEDLAAAYTAQSGFSVTVQGGGSTQGIRDVAAGRAEVGCSTRHKVSNPDERGAKLVTVGWDSLVAIVHPSNPVTRISKSDLQAVLEGKITRWNALGGPDLPIEVVVRGDPESGVGLLLRSILFGDPRHAFADGVTSKPDSAAVEAEVERNPGALAVTLGGRVAARQVKALGLGNAVSGYDTIASGGYPLVIPMYLVVPKRASDDVMNLLKLVKGNAGQQIIKSKGLVTMKDGKDLFARYQKSIAEARKNAAE
ncbi:MAG: substrate-binding domain-containing protein [Kiloniellales bacterium]|nr:substrate-binding domain-containing protein [Kiloniellales bacterium]